MKKKLVNILIKNTNQYFTLGLTSILQDDYIRKRISVNILNQDNSHRADLMILADDASSFVWACNTSASNVRNAIFTIQVRSLSNVSSFRQYQSGIIKHHDSVKNVLNWIKRELQERKTLIPPSPDFNQLSLTSRERQVLSSIAQGFQPSEIAKLLKLHVKTVSVHKCNAMRKLGFTRNHELYHWLLSGEGEKHRYCS